MTKGLKTAVAVLIAAFMALFLISGTAAAAPKADGHEKTEENDDNHHPSGKDRTNEPDDAEEGEFQGKSKSEPDDDDHGPERDFDEGDGANEDGIEDKPGMGGGMHTSDQDGNNGCGNDDDFEDDNEGLCGPRDRTEPEVDAEEEEQDEEVEDKTCPAGTTMVDDECVKVKGDDTEKDETEKVETDVLGEVLERDTTDSVDTDVDGEVLGRLPVTGPAASGAEVLGVQLERAPEAAPAVLGAQFNRTAAAALARTGVGIVSLVALGLGLVTLGAMISRRRSNA